MGISVGWDDREQTIVRMTFVGQWTNEELRVTGLQAILMVSSVKQPVYVISDFSASDNLPIGVLWQARDLNRLRPANWAAGITITQDFLVKNLLDAFGLIYLLSRRHRLYVVRGLDEAYAIIRQIKQEHLVT